MHRRDRLAVFGSLPVEGQHVCKPGLSHEARIPDERVRQKEAGGTCDEKVSSSPKLFNIKLLV